VLQDRHLGHYTKGVSPSTCVPTRARAARVPLARNQKTHDSLHPNDSRTGSSGHWPNYRRRLYCLTRDTRRSQTVLERTKVLCTYKHNPWLARSRHTHRHLKILASIDTNTPTSSPLPFSTFFMCSCSFGNLPSSPTLPQEPLRAQSNLDPQKTQDSSKSHPYSPVRPRIWLY